MGEGQAERATVESGGEDRGVWGLIPSSGVTGEVVGRRRARSVLLGRRNRRQPVRGSGPACWDGPRPMGRPGALFSLSPLLFLFNFFSVFPATFASSF